MPCGGHAPAQAWHAKVMLKLRTAVSAPWRIYLTERSLVMVRGLPCLLPAGAARPLDERQRQAGWRAGHCSATQAGAATRREKAGEVPRHHRCMYTYSDQKRTVILAKRQMCLVSDYKMVKPVMLGLSGLAHVLTAGGWG